MSQKKQHMVIGGIIALIGIFYLSTLREGHDWGGDFSMYIHHAKNIVEGIDYGDTGYLYNPLYSTLGPETFPPVFPLLITPVYYWFGLHLPAMKIELVGLFLIALWLIYRCFQHDLPFPYIGALVLFIGFNPRFWEFKDHILSDIPFLLFIYLSLWVVHQTYQMTFSNRSQLFYAFMSGILVYLAYGTRSLGLLLIPCFVMTDLIRVKKIRRITVILTVAFGLLMALQAFLSHNDSGYLDQFTYISVQRVVQNAITYTRSLSLFLHNGFFHVVRHLVFGTTCVMAAIGYGVKVKKGITVFELFLLFYLLAILIFPFTQTRYLIPLFPLYLVYLFTGVHHLKSKSLIIIVTVCLVGSYLGLYNTLSYGPLPEGIHTPEAIDLFTSVKHNTSEQDVIIFQKPRVLALFTERKAAAYHPTQDDQELWNYFQSVDATYVITGLFDSAYFSDFMEKYQERFQVVDSNSDFAIYKIL